MAQPIAGNQNFTKVENHAGQFGMLRTQEARVAGDAHVGGSLRANEVMGGLVVSVPAGKVLQKAELQTVPGSLGSGASAACVLRSNTSTNFTFPAGDNSTIVATRVTVSTPYTSAGAAQLTAGPANAASGAASTLVFNNVALSQLSTAGDVVSVSSGAASTFSSAGTPPGVPANAGYFMVTGAVTAAFTAGAADVDVWYYQ